MGGASALSRSDPFVLCQIDPHQERPLPTGEHPSSDIIHAGRRAGLPDVIRAKGA